MREGRVLKWVYQKERVFCYNCVWKFIGRLNANPYHKGDILERETERDSIRLGDLFLGFSIRDFV